METIGTFTGRTVGNWCSEADLWVDEVLVQLGYTTGSLSDKLTSLSNTRRDATCGMSPACGGCGVNSSSFLFFVTRDDSTMWGGWNCGGEYLISYWNRYADAQVYSHEVGHGFGANDEYCVPSQDYCCGWVSGTWGCSNTGGCLSGPNDNCDPTCGATCGSTDCQDGCPAANCTTHTACAMDGSGTLTYCNPTRRQMGWIDTDGDGGLDCLESACGTDPNDPASVPGCVNLPPVCDLGGPYTAECNGAVTSIPLDGSGSSEPEGHPLTYTWESDCPGSSFQNGGTARPTLLSAGPPPCPVSCNVRLTVTDDQNASASCATTVGVVDTTPPFTVAPPPITLECTEQGGVSKGDPRLAGWLDATGTDVCTAVTKSNEAPPFFPARCPRGTPTQVHFHTEDACGNSSTASAAVTVLDTTPPYLVAPPPLVLECATQGGVLRDDPSIVAWLALAHASDACDTVTITNDAPPLFPAGGGTGPSRGSQSGPPTAAAHSLGGLGARWRNAGKDHRRILSPAGAVTCGPRSMATLTLRSPTRDLSPTISATAPPPRSPVRVEPAGGRERTRGRALEARLRDGRTQRPPPR